MYLSGAGVVNKTKDREELATFLAWHDIPHPLHLSHINYQQGSFFYFYGTSVFIFECKLHSRGVLQPLPKRFQKKNLNNYSD